jgi:hypothetical protein
VEKSPKVSPKPFFAKIFTDTDLWKNRPKFRPSHFLPKFLQTLICGKSGPKILGGFRNFQKTAQRKQYSPIGENSPNV